MGETNKVFVLIGVLCASILEKFYGLPSIMQALLILMALDMLAGFVIAWQKNKISSHAAFFGVTRKGAQLILVSMASLLQPFIKVEIPLANVLAAYYVYVECLSILEHASKLGVPIPSFLKDALIRLNPDTKPIKESEKL